jgi:hypothetical protein
MTATNPRDRETVRRLLAEHLPSGFPTTPSALTVGDVACRMVSEHARGIECFSDRDLAISRALVVSSVEIPERERMVGRRVKELLADAGLDMTDAYIGERYWIKFQGALIVMLMGRTGGRAVAFGCERQAP